VPVNTTPAEYDANLAGWIRARQVMAGEDAVKVAGKLNPGANQRETP